MYLHCKAGFFEVDRWDGTPVPAKGQQKELARLSRFGATLVVVRCRHREQLEALLALAGPRLNRRRPPRVWKSPKGWDYQWRVYLERDEWATVMAVIALDIDYRNFKSWCQANAPEKHHLANDIWDAAYADGGPGLF